MLGSPVSYYLNPRVAQEPQKGKEYESLCCPYKDESFCFRVVLKQLVGRTSKKDPTVRENKRYLLS